MLEAIIRSEGKDVRNKSPHGSSRPSTRPRLRGI
jgi:hypothetical protein